MELRKLPANVILMRDPKQTPGRPLPAPGWRGLGGLARAGAGWRGLARAGAGWRGLARAGAGWRGLARAGAGWGWGA